MYEHRPLLEQTLQDSQERLLIISPWIRANSVDKRFLQQFENLLRRGEYKFSLGTVWEKKMMIKSTHLTFKLRRIFKN